MEIFFWNVNCAMWRGWCCVVEDRDDTSVGSYTHMILNGRLWSTSPNYASPYNGLWRRRRRRPTHGELNIHARVCRFVQ